MSDENAKQDVRNIMNEMVAIAKAEGITLSETIVENSLNKECNFAYGTKNILPKKCGTKKQKE
jgi:hypothetical protein